MKKYLSAFLIPWLLSYFYGCASSGYISLEEAPGYSTDYDIHIKTEDKTFILPSPPQPNFYNDQNSDEVVCSEWILGNEYVSLVYREKVPLSSNAAAYYIIPDTSTVMNNEIREVSYYKSNSAATGLLIVGGALVLGIIIFLATFKLDMNFPSQNGKLFL